MRTAFEPEGDVRSVDLLGAFATLWRQRAGGVVEFSAPGRAVRFDVFEGELVAVSSSDDSFETAEILRRAEKLSQEALADGRIPRGSDRARYLRDLGLLSDRDWRWGEKLRIVEILSDLVGWLEGTYRYDAAADPEPSDFQIGIHRVVLELFLRSSDLAFIHHSLGAPDAALERTSDFDERFASLGLTPDALVVAAAIDGKATAAEISRRTPPDPFSVEKLLAALVTLGLVHPEYAVEHPPARGSVPRPEPPPPPPAAVATEPDREAAPPPPEREAFPPPEPEVAAPPPAPPAPEPPPEPAPEPTPEPTPEPAPEAEDDLELLEMPSPVPSAEETPGVELWGAAPAEPLDQPLDGISAPEFGAARRRGLSPVWLPILLAAGVAALLLLRSREPSPASRGVLPATASEAPTGPPSNPAPTPAAPALVPTAAPAVVLPTAMPAAVPSPPPPTVAARPAPARPVTPRDRDDWLALAARDRRRLESDGTARFSIQLELVCELPSLDEAWVYDRDGAMWLLTASHQGRTCFRVFWGRYPTLEEARNAKGSVPRFFFTPTNRPVVVSTSGALLR